MIGGHTDNILTLPKILMLLYTSPSNEMEWTFVPSTIDNLRDENGKLKVAWLGQKLRIELTPSEYITIRNSEHRLEDVGMYVKDPNDWRVCEVVMKEPDKPYMVV